MAEPPPRQRHRPRLVIAVLAFGGIVMAVVQTVTVPLLPHLPGLLDSTPETVGWTVTATLLTGAVSTPVLGRVGDMYGKREVLLGTLLALVVGALMCALSSHVLVVIVGRGLQGAALAVVPLGISLMRDELPPQRVPAAVALMSATVGVGASLGVPMAALVMQYADWHTVFWVVAAVGLLDLVLVLALVPRSRTHSGGRFDTLGTVGLTVALVSLLLVVSKGAAWGWTSAAVWGLLATALVVGAGWAVYELRVRDPIMDLRVMSRPAVLLINAVGLLTGFAFFVNSLVTAQLVQEPTATGYGLGVSVFVSGLALLPAGLAMLLFSPLSARITLARGARFTAALGTAITALGYGVRMFTSEDLAAVVVGATVVAIGTAIAYSALPTLLMRYVPVTYTGAANGLNVFTRTVGQAVGSAVVAAVLATMTMDVGGGSAPTLGAYLTVFAVAGAVSLAALAVILCVPPHRPGSGIQRTSPAASAQEDP